MRDGEMSGYMDAIRQNNAILVRNLLAKVDCSVWEDTVLTHESKFGDTLLTYAAGLGRLDIVHDLVRKIESFVQLHRHNLTVCDFLDHETRRGKTALSEAVKNNHPHVVSTLLKYRVDASKPTKMHRKSALGWAVPDDRGGVRRVVDGGDEDAG
jgi:ankyrin repeat protein